MEVAQMKTFLKELLNTVSNILVPICALICAIMEAVHAPTKAILVVKAIEYWAFNVSGTAERLQQTKMKLK